MKHILLLLAITGLIISACGPAPEPTLSAGDVQGTAMAVALTMVSETQAAIPTATPIPPTETQIPTLIPSPTPTVILQPTLGGFPTNTPVGGDPCNQPLTSWEGESAKLIIKNRTQPKGLVTISLYFTTDLGQCGYIGSQFNNTVTMSVPIGRFSAGAFVDGKKDFKVFGGGRITPGGWSLWVENEAIVLRAGCAPDC